VPWDDGGVTFFVRHRYGKAERDFPIERFPELLDELRDDDAEHPDVCVHHESEWSVSVFPGGVLILENVERDDPPHRSPLLSRDEILEVMSDVARGDIITALRRHAWSRG
jgi:hypothetical protein